MTETFIGIAALTAMFVAMALRTPVGLAMLATGFGGVYVLNGFQSASAILLTETYSATSNFSLTVMPLFILMGNVATNAGFSRMLYQAAFAWVGVFRGGLASASVVGCAAFAAVSGSSIATAVTIGRVAMPEMKRFGYSDSLSTGSIAAGGTLGLLIPPSTAFVIYAILTEESIGRLFMAGILPGLVLTTLFVGTIWLLTLRNEDAGPRGEKVSLRERLKALVGASPMIAVIVASIGGIYLGIFTPVEAAGIGAALIIVFAVAGRLLTWAKFTDALQETVRTSATLYLIVIGASVLNPFLAFTHIPERLGEFLAFSGLGPYAILGLILLAYIVLGMFMDGLSMLVVTIPIVYPVIVALGFDPIWFGVLVVIVIEMGLITPPVGLNVFVVKKVAKDVPMLTIYRGVLPFWMAMFIGLGLIIAFPNIALLIPNSMFN